MIKFDESGIIEEVVWVALRKQIELHAGKDKNITDVRINYQLRIPKYGTSTVFWYS